jgi:hypothetical protein
MRQGLIPRFRAQLAVRFIPCLNKTVRRTATSPFGHGATELARVRKQREGRQEACSAKRNCSADDSLLKRSLIQRLAARTSRASSSWRCVNRFLRSFHA